ncbi:MAG TPA: isoprenylcysteine carboxylmethyltransferase family protein [Bacteroidota bacterium]|nr:isoprenylcysteine carboxylmethyltransferase family protein [Bacteroidota bacterium]
MKLSKFLFKNRSYTPLPFLLVMVIFAKPNLYSMITGFLIALLGEMIRFWGVCYIGSESRTTGKVGGTKLLVSGPFAYVRNPLYVGNILIYMGIGVMSNALFPYLIIFGFIFFVFQYYFIIIEEEKYLKDEFKEDYIEYYKSVRRFIPKLRPYKKSNNKIHFEFSRGISSERRTLQGFSISILILIIIWIFR